MTDDEFKQATRAGIERFVAESERDAKGVERFLERVTYVAVDGAGEDGWADLKQRLGNADAFIRVFYLAVNPELFGPICQGAARHGLVTRHARVVLEKPIGKDSRSEEHTSELQSLMRISYAVFCLKKKKQHKKIIDRQ